MAKNFTVEEFVALQKENERLEDDLKTANEHCAQLEKENRELRKQLAEIDNRTTLTVESIDKIIGNLPLDRVPEILSQFSREELNRLDNINVIVLIDDSSEETLAAEILCATGTKRDYFIPVNPDEQLFLDMEAEFDILVVTEKCYDRTLAGNDTTSKIIVSYGDAVEDLRNILKRVGQKA